MAFRLLSRPDKMLHQMLAPEGGHGNACSDTLLRAACDEAARVGILPDWKTGARGPPCGHDLGIGPRSGPDPFEEIEYQGVDGIRRGGLSHAATVARVVWT